VPTDEFQKGEGILNPRSPNVSQPTFETWRAADGTVITIRPIRAADLALEQEFVKGLSKPTGYQRLMSARSPSLEELKRFTDIDYERELALIATTPVQGRERQIGVARYVKESSSSGDAEFAIVLSDDWQGRGLGTKLLVSLVAAAKSHGVRRVVGTTLSVNTGMLALGRKLGFKLASDPRVATITNLTLDLAAWPPPAAAGVDDRR
jgi:acetyltransferase